MPKYNVIFNVSGERTYQVEAPDEETAIKTARDVGSIVNETEESSDLEHCELAE